MVYFTSKEPTGDIKTDPNRANSMAVGFDIMKDEYIVGFMVLDGYSMIKRLITAHPRIQWYLGNVLICAQNPHHSHIIA